MLGAGEHRPEILHPAAFLPTHGSEADVEKNEPVRRTARSTSAKHPSVSPRTDRARARTVVIRAPPAGRLELRRFESRAILQGDALWVTRTRIGQLLCGEVQFEFPASRSQGLLPL